MGAGRGRGQEKPEERRVRFGSPGSPSLPTEAMCERFRSMSPFLPRTPRVLAFVATLLVTSFTSGCGGDGGIHLPDAVVRDSSGVRIVEYTLETPVTALPHAPGLHLAPTPTLRIGVMEGNPEYQLSRPVAGARLSDGSIALLEGTPAEIRIYAPDGTFRNRAGRQGEGPGEFTNPGALVALPGDTLLVWDGRFRRLNRFAVDGTFLHAVTLQETAPLESIRQVALLGHGGALLFGSTASMDELGNRGRIVEPWGALPVTPEGTRLPVVAERPGMEQELRIRSNAGGEIVSVSIMGRWWWERGYAAPSGEGAWFANRSTAEVIHIHPERGVDRRFRLLAPSEPFTAEVIRELEALEMTAAEEGGFRAAMEADIALREYPERIPPVERVFGDAAGRAWLGLLTMPRRTLPSSSDTAISLWAVFERDGTLLGAVRLPERSRPLWANAEGVLLVEHDDMDVPYLAWYLFVDTPESP